MPLARPSQLQATASAIACVLVLSLIPTVASAVPAHDLVLPPTKPPVSAGQVPPTSPAPKRACELKGGGSRAHGETIQVLGGKRYRCNDGTWEQYAYA